MRNRSKPYNFGARCTCTQEVFPRDEPVNSRVAGPAIVGRSRQLIQKNRST
jgi:hypothetical protein